MLSCIFLARNYTNYLRLGGSLLQLGTQFAQLIADMYGGKNSSCVFMAALFGHKKSPGSETVVNTTTSYQTNQTTQPCFSSHIKKKSRFFPFSFYNFSFIQIYVITILFLHCKNVATVFTVSTVTTTIGKQVGWQEGTLFFFVKVD